MDREWLARTSGWLSATAVGWTVFSAVSLYAEGRGLPRTLVSRGGQGLRLHHFFRASPATHLTSRSASSLVLYIENPTRSSDPPGIFKTSTGRGA
jgi:hypothetical protein